MIELYLWDEMGLYTETVLADEMGEMPIRSTPTKPMKLTKTQSALWDNGSWLKIKTPEPVIAPVVEEVKEDA